MILWDSRLIHGGWIGSGRKSEKQDPAKATLARLAMTVSMMHRNRADNKCILDRFEAFKAG